MADHLTITAEMLKLMRKATGVTFHHLKGSRDGQIGLIQALSAELETRTLLECRSLVNVYGGRYGQADTAKCFEYICSSQYCDHWSAVRTLLKVGDRVSLEWVKGALVHQNLRDLGCDTNQLYLVVERGAGRSSKRFKLMLATSVITPATSYPMIEVAA